MKIIITKEEKEIIKKIIKKYDYYVKKGKCREITICDVATKPDKECCKNCNLYKSDVCNFLVALDEQLSVCYRILEIATVEK